MNNFKNKWSDFKYKFISNFQSFMVGRYGVDELYRFLSIFTTVLLVIQIFTKNAVLNIFVFVLFGFTLYRFFSKNVVQRRKENQLYLKAKNALTSWFKLTKRKMTESKDYSFKKCPHCHKTLRLPKKKGKHVVVCPNCKKEFEVKI